MGNGAADQGSTLEKSTSRFKFVNLIFFVIPLLKLITHYIVISFYFNKHIYKSKKSNNKLHTKIIMPL